MKLMVRWDKQLLRIFVWFLLLSALVLILSVMTRSTRLLLIATVALGLFLAVYHFIRLTRDKRRVTYGAFGCLLLLSGWMVLGGKPVDVDALRGEYVRQLGSFQDVRYRWGGETGTGIDCSGLARVALYKAMFMQGIKQANPKLMGPMLWEFWWRDMSALAMRNQVYNYTRPIGEIPKLAGYDTSKLKPGDLAVMNSGMHVLIYFGNGKWIEASPEDQKVVANKAPADTHRGWFTAGPVVLMRWWILE